MARWLFRRRSARWSPGWETQRLNALRQHCLPEQIRNTGVACIVGVEIVPPPVTKQRRATQRADRVDSANAGQAHCRAAMRCTDAGDDLIVDCGMQVPCCQAEE